MDNENKNVIKSLFLIVAIIGVLVVAFVGLSAFDIHDYTANNTDNNNIIADNDNLIIDFSLKGDKEITLFLGDTYNEPGYVATGNDGKDYHDKVVVEGTVNTNKIGKYTIKYTINYKTIFTTLRRTVNVVSTNIPVQSIKTNKEEYTLDINEFVNIKTSIKPSNATNKTLIWTSNDPSIARVSNGTIKGIAYGTTTITIQDSSRTVSKTVRVTVKKIIQVSFKLKGSKTVSIYVGGTYTEPGYTAKDNNGKDYSSKVVVSGTVNTNKAGTYKLTYTLKLEGIKKTLTRKVKVVTKTIPVTAINTDKNSYSVYTGNSFNISASVLPTDATNKNLTWVSSNSGVATVSNGTVRGVAPGTANITIYDSTKKVSKTVSVSVSNKPVVKTEEKIHFIKQSVSVSSAGDAILLESNGHYGIIDTGLENETDNNHIYNYLKSVGVTSLDFMLITHNHNDHIGGAVFLMDRFPVGRLYIKTYLGKDKTAKEKKRMSKYKALINKAKAKGTAITYIDKSFKDGKGFTLQDMNILLYNTKQEIHDNENGNAVIQLVKTNGHRVLLMSDLYSYTENRNLILKLSKKKAFQGIDVLKMPHHGYAACAFKDNKAAAKNLSPKNIVVTGASSVCGQVFSSKIPTHYVKKINKSALVVSLNSTVTIS